MADYARMGTEVSAKSASYIGMGAPRRDRPMVLLGRVRGARRLLRPLAGLFCLAALPCMAALGGCSVSMPMASLMPNAHDDDEITGSVVKPQLSDWLGKEDWQEAKPAFAQALEEKDAAAVAWDNPKSGARGRFMALGDAYPGVSGTCRAFHADVDRAQRYKAVEGVACADKSGSWQVTELKAPKRS